MENIVLVLRQAADDCKDDRADHAALFRLAATEILAARGEAAKLRLDRPEPEPDLDRLTDRMRETARDYDSEYVEIPELLRAGAMAVDILRHDLVVRGRRFDELSAERERIAQRADELDRKLNAAEYHRDNARSEVERLNGVIERITIAVQDFTKNSRIS